MSALATLRAQLEAALAEIKGAETTSDLQRRYQFVCAATRLTIDASVLAMRAQSEASADFAVDPDDCGDTFNRLARKGSRRVGDNNMNGIV